MSVEHIEVLVEEPSMEAALRVLLPRVVSGRSFEIRPYQCKQELLKYLPQRLRGYARWMPEGWRIVVIADRDNDDCHALKTHLEEVASEAGFTTRTASHGSHWTVVNRLAIEELESWYFGDWEAVRAAYPRVPSTIPSQAKYRNPMRSPAGHRKHSNESSNGQGILQAACGRERPQQPLQRTWSRTRTDHTAFRCCCPSFVNWSPRRWLSFRCQPNRRRERWISAACVGRSLQ